MGEGGEEGKAQKRVVVESLGWLTESSIMPKKQRVIEGVGPSSILELKAQLYKSQEESKRLPKESGHADHLDVHRAKSKISAHDAFSFKNSGVDSRAAKDKLEMKAVKDGSASYAALERKAELYDKLVRGEVSDEEDQEKYCVDFLRKGVSGPTQVHENSNKESHDRDYEESSSFLPNTKAPPLGGASNTLDRNEHKRFVKEVHNEASEAREKVSELKQRRQDQASARREKLKQAYLRKQVEKLKASSKLEQT